MSGLKPYRYAVFFAALIIAFFCSDFKSMGNRPTKPLDFFKPNKIFVAAHRCGWRYAPENSVEALKKCIEDGVDIAEIDLKRTKDRQLIVLHDNTLDRSTTGKGNPEDYTLVEIKKMHIRDGSGHPTNCRIATLKEILTIAKDKIIIDVDKGIEFFDEANSLIDSMNMTSQIIFNVNDVPFESLMKKTETVNPNLWLIVIVSPSSRTTESIIKSYQSHPNTIVQTVFSTDTVSILQQIPTIKSRNPIWFNALWPEHNANHDDDIAVLKNKPDESWGWLIKHGATIIQTDRPKELLEYLKKRKLHQ